MCDVEHLNLVVKMLIPKQAKLYIRTVYILIQLSEGCSQIFFCICAKEPKERHCQTASNELTGKLHLKCSIKA